MLFLMFIFLHLSRWQGAINGVRRQWKQSGGKTTQNKTEAGAKRSGDVDAPGSAPGPDDQSPCGLLLRKIVSARREAAPRRLLYACLTDGCLYRPRLRAVKTRHSKRRPITVSVVALLAAGT